MKIETKAYGRIEVEDRQIIAFPNGILGFENHHKMALLDSEQSPFYWLQSLDDADTAFVLINPLLLRPDYEINIPDDELAEIEIHDPDDILLFAIVTVPENQREMTANLMGPIIINRIRHVGKQFIVNDPRWKVRHGILEELGKAGKS